MSAASLDELIVMAEALSPLEKVRLVERVMATLEDDLTEQQKAPLPSLYGLWKDLEVRVSAEDIDEARQEMWGNFPREV